MKKGADRSSRVRFGVGWKIMSLNAFLLLTSILTVVWIATQLFTDNNTALIQQMNSDAALSLALESRQIFESTFARSKELGAILLEPELSSAAQNRQIETFLSSDEDVLGLYVFNADSKGRLKVLARALTATLKSQDPLEDQKIFDSLSQDSDVALSRVLEEGSAEIFWKVMPGSVPTLILANPLVKTGNNYTSGVVTIVQQSKFDKSFSAFRNVLSYLIDKRGTLLVHPDAARVAARENLKDSGVVKLFLQGKLSNGQHRFQDPQTKEWRLGAFQTVGIGGLGVVAEVPEEQALAAAHQVQFRSALVALIILALSFMMGYVFSGTITWPLTLLSDAAHKISVGDFDIHLMPRGSDEIAVLSLTFNQMAKDLEHREKVMTTFNKFHNKEIAEKILSGDVKLGGEKKNAIVFFSDIRGFTSMSEKMRAEEVVQMLNEYMTSMVAIIRENFGVVDKYVGDAIMALWGVPDEKEADSFYALKACLAMREELAQFNESRLAQGKEPLFIGMGLNSGEVIAGNIGSDEKMEYTVIGNTVNVASRIESATKVYGTDLLISQDLYEKHKNQFLFEVVESLTVKGKEDALTLYKVLGFVAENGDKVIIETPYSSYKAEKSDKVVTSENALFTSQKNFPRSKMTLNPSQPLSEKTWFVFQGSELKGEMTWHSIEDGLWEGSLDEHIVISEELNGPWRNLRMTAELKRFVADAKKVREKKAG